MNEKRFKIINVSCTNIDVETYVISNDDNADDDEVFELYESKERSQELCDMINKLIDENKELKQFQENVVEFLDEKIKYYRKQPCLAVKLPVDCEYRHSCLHNNSVNVCNKAKENAYRELEKELKE